MTRIYKEGTGTQDHPISGPVFGTAVNIPQYANCAEDCSRSEETSGLNDLRPYLVELMCGVSAFSSLLELQRDILMLTRSLIYCGGRSFTIL